MFAAFLLALAPVVAREAYVTAAASSTVASAPNYVYGALALIGSIRSFDKARDIFVLVDDVTLATYPGVRPMFERNGARIIKTVQLRADKSLRTNAPTKWIGAFTKLGLLQMSLLNYTKLLFMDADGVLLNSAEPLFRLPFPAGTDLYGMRDVYGCSEPNDTPSLMSALFLWTNRGEPDTSLGNMIVNFLLASAGEQRSFVGSQRIMAAAVGSRLQLLNENLATCVHRCMCKSKGTGLKSLAKVVYVHFMSVSINMISAAMTVLENKTYPWVKSTVHSAYEADCTGPAYRMWLGSFRSAIDRYGQNGLLVTDPCGAAIPSRDRGPCIPFMQTTIFGMYNLSHAYDGDMDTYLLSRYHGDVDDYVLLQLPIDGGVVQRIEVVTGKPVLTVMKSAIDTSRLKHGIDYALTADGAVLGASGLLYRRVRNVVFRLLKKPASSFAIREFIMSNMPAFTTQFVTKRRGLRTSPDGQFGFFNRSWQFTRSIAVTDRWHDFPNLFDGDVKTATNIRSPPPGAGLHVHLGHPLFVCGVSIHAGADVGESHDSFISDNVYVNDGALTMAQNLTGTTMQTKSHYPFNVFNLLIEFGNHKGQHLSIREIEFLAPLSHDDAGCTPYHAT